MKITLKEKNRFKLWCVLHPNTSPCTYCCMFRRDIWRRESCYTWPRGHCLFQIEYHPNIYITDENNIKRKK